MESALSEVEWVATRQVEGLAEFNDATGQAAMAGSNPSHPLSGVTFK
jgi:hypothetical protein